MYFEIILCIILCYNLKFLKNKSFKMFIGKKSDDLFIGKEKRKKEREENACMMGCKATPINICKLIRKRNKLEI